MELTDDTIARIVQSCDRNSTCGTIWPGCACCDRVYMHADDCEIYMSRKAMRQAT